MSKQLDNLEVNRISISRYENDFSIVENIIKYKKVPRQLINGLGKGKWALIQIKIDKDIYIDSIIPEYFIIEILKDLFVGNETIKLHIDSVIIWENADSTVDSLDSLKLPHNVSLGKDSSIIKINFTEELKIQKIIELINNLATVHKLKPYNEKTIIDIKNKKISLIFEIDNGIIKTGNKNLVLNSIEKILNVKNIAEYIVYFVNINKILSDWEGKREGSLIINKDGKNLSENKLDN